MTLLQTIYEEIQPHIKPAMIIATLPITNIASIEYIEILCNNTNSILIVLKGNKILVSPVIHDENFDGCAATLHLTEFRKVMAKSIHPMHIIDINKDDLLKEILTALSNFQVGNEIISHNTL